MCNVSLKWALTMECNLVVSWNTYKTSEDDLKYVETYGAEM
jgi:hypothetical protein